MSRVENSEGQVMPEPAYLQDDFFRDLPRKGEEYDLEAFFKRLRTRLVGAYGPKLASTTLQLAVAARIAGFAAYLPERTAANIGRALTSTNREQIAISRDPRGAAIFTPETVLALGAVMQIIKKTPKAVDTVNMPQYLRQHGIVHQAVKALGKNPIVRQFDTPFNRQEGIYSPTKTK